MTPLYISKYHNIIISNLKHKTRKPRATSFMPLLKKHFQQVLLVFLKGLPSFQRGGGGAGGGVNNWHVSSIMTLKKIRLFNWLCYWKTFVKKSGILLLLLVMLLLYSLSSIQLYWSIDTFLRIDQGAANKCICNFFQE